MKRLTTGVAAVLMALAVTSCGNSGDGGGSTTGSDTNTSSESAGGGDAEAWADKVCSAMKDDVGALTAQPDLDLSNPQAAKDGLIAFLGTLSTSLDGMSNAVKEAGTPPVENGEEAVKGFVDQIGTAKDAVTSAKSKVEAAPVNDPTAFQTAITEATQDLSALEDMEDPTASFENNPELKAAYNNAASCKELKGQLSPTS
jgi:hypothetical protein